MAHSHVIFGAGLETARPTVRTIGLNDLKDALMRGLDDFGAMPSHAVFLCLIYPIVGFVLYRLAVGYNVLPLLFPLVAGFALVGPIAALGVYEMSRRREHGLDVSWRDAIDVLRSPSIAAIMVLALMLVAIFIVWLAVAQAIYVANFGYQPAAAMPDFVRQVVTTPAGWSLIIVGNGVGFLFAATVLTVSVVSFPLLLDRDVDFVTAMVTSVRAVVTSPLPMIGWAAIIVVLLIVSAIPYFLGLIVTVPVLGHATWHLYRRIVAPA